LDVDIIKICFVLVTTLFTDHLSQQLLLHASTAGVAASIVSLGATLCVDMASTMSMSASVLSALAFMAALSIGFRPLAGTYSVKIMLLRLHEQGVSLDMAVN
jgi:hypothetical protein